MSADRNLLFGILALQLNFVTRDQLVEGMHKWVLDKTKGLGQIFVAANVMDADQFKLLDALVDKHVQKHGGDIQKSILQLSSVDPHATQQLRAIEDSDLQATMEFVSAKTVDPFATQPFQPAPKRTPGRFRIIRPHAKGGLGEVFVARDTELSREVALKEILAPYADDTERRERFLREAEITGRLEHPGIVPVYGLGTYEDGRPFYAMKFIKGDSLKDAIDKFHADLETKVAKSFMTGNAGIKFREMLGRFVDVCNAVHYAHSRGILHRDLKPGNVMIGEYGETLVVDWGFAKVLGERVGDGSDRSIIQPANPNTTDGTVEGIAVGTPAFISPEQAIGVVEQLGPATDVFSLGAILYYLLTGGAPYKADSVAECLKLAKRADFPAPVKVCPKLPLELDAICCKAMKLESVDRYSSAKAISDEILRFLGDEPVNAFPELVHRRSMRWIRKHPKIVSAVAGSVLILVACSMVFGFVVAAKNRRLVIFAQAENAAKERERIARHDAEKNRDAAIQEKVRAEGLLYATLLGQAQADLSRGNLVGATYALENCALNQRAWEFDYLYSVANRDCVMFTNSDSNRATISCMAWSPDGTQLTVGYEDGTQILWNSQTGEEISTFKLHDGQVSYLAWSPDGKKIASWSAGGNCVIWDLRGSRSDSQIELELVVQLWWSKDGVCKSISLTDAAITIHNFATGEALLTIDNSELKAVTVSVSRDENEIATVSDNGTIVIWDASIRERLSTFESVFDIDIVADNLYWSPSGSQLAATSDDGVIRILDRESVKKQFSHRGDFAWCPSGARFAVSGSSGIEVRDSVTDAIVLLLRGRRCDKLVLSPDGKRISASSYDKVGIWQAMTTREVRSFSAKGWDSSQISSWSPDGTELFYGGHIYDLFSGKQKSDMEYSCLSWSPDGMYFVHDALETIIFDAKNLRRVKTLENSGTFKLGVRWSPDGTRIVASEPDRKRDGCWLRVWDVESGKNINNFWFRDPITGIYWNPKNENLLLQQHHGIFPQVSLFKPNGEVKKHGVGSRSLTFGSTVSWNPDGDFYCNVGDSQTCIFDAEGNIRSVLGGKSINCVSWSPTGKRVVTGNFDGTLTIWNPDTGLQLLTIIAHDGPVERVEWNPSSSKIVSIGSNGNARLWEADVAVSNANTLSTPIWDRQRLVQWAAWNPDWHKAQASAAERAKQWFAAAFHLRPLAKRDPADHSLSDRLSNAERMLILAKNRQQHPEKNPFEDPF